MVNSELILGCAVFSKGLLIKGFLCLCYKLSKPIVSSNYQNNGKPEKKEYNRWMVMVEMVNRWTVEPLNRWTVDGGNGYFTPRIFATNGEINVKSKQLYRPLSQLLSEKSDVSYSDTSVWFKRQISFSSLQSFIICIRGSWSKQYNIPTEKRMEALISQILLQILVKNYVNKPGGYYIKPDTY